LTKPAVLLFAHGSRDPQWARPFEALAASLRELIDAPVALAYLEFMKPTLAEAIDGLAKQASEIRVIPVFLGTGGHVKEDLPRLVQEARGKHPGMSIGIDPTIGDQSAVIAAIAGVIAEK
jgi:sirohydrochlorin cobaltochelatase